ncbi:MAG: DoxX family protein [Chitinophagales bacterium]
MQYNNEKNRNTALLFIRLLLGIIFLLQGYGKVFSIGVDNLYNSFFIDYENTFLPVWLLTLTAYYTSFAELIGGALLVLGLFRNFALYMLASVLLIVSFGHGLMMPIWDLQHVLFRAILLIPLLLLPEEWDNWQLQNLMNGKIERK